MIDQHLNQKEKGKKCNFSAPDVCSGTHNTGIGRRHLNNPVNCDEANAAKKQLVLPKWNGSVYTEHITNAVFYVHQIPQTYRSHCIGIKIVWKILDNYFCTCIKGWGGIF